MSFISLEFIILFSVVVLLYFNLRQGRRWVLLLTASYIFYMFANVYHIVLIIFSTLVDYVVSQQMGKLEPSETRRRQLLLLISIVVNLGVLFYFKYFNFFTESTVGILSIIGINADLATHSQILPVGISFYTFQSMAYTFDVYRRQIEPEKHFGIFATYIAFFPQLVAGPIERASNMLPQFSKKISFDYDRVVSGLRLVLFGAFKKVVIADRLAVYVNEVYNHPTEYSGVILVIATIFFGYQIYCDFSGYSDIAIGTARVLGFDLMRNFNHPYLANSIRDFWRRWHISLSTWFRDYVYIPLGGNRVSIGRNMFNLFVVFLVSGLWHGASWTFVIWGAVHGVFIAIETLFAAKPRQQKFLIPQWISMIFIFCVVNFAWIFFRANSFDDAIYVIQHMFDLSRGFSDISAPFTGVDLLPRTTLVLSFTLIAGLQITEFFNEHWKLADRVLSYMPIRWGVYYAAIFLIIFTLGDLSVEQTFIYFQF